jgi:hypothetical protein
VAFNDAEKLRHFFLNIKISEILVS